MSRRPNNRLPKNAKAKRGRNRTRKNRDTLRIAKGTLPRSSGQVLTSFFDHIQRPELPLLLRFLHEFWEKHTAAADSGPVAPINPDLVLRAVPFERLSHSGMPLDQLLPFVQDLLEHHIVKTSHPLFLGYVTPPSLDIAALGEALMAITNQNVMFASLSPLGTAMEISVISWLGEIVGYPIPCGGVLTSGGSESNSYGLAVARHRKLGRDTIRKGNYAERRRLRVYCSTETHGSIDKAAAHLGIGTENVVRISVDENHAIRVPELRDAIEADIASRDYLSTAIIGNAGTLHCCAFDDFRQLRDIADEYDMWLHADAAYGGFLRLASPPPAGAMHVSLADSVTLDPHKLLFIPFDCGSFLVRNQMRLLECFGTTGEYLTPETPAGLHDFANFGMQLGRSNKALPVWLTLKRFGIDAFAEEYSRLLGLARHLRDKILADSRYELLAPVPGTAVCFRWKAGPAKQLDEINRQLLKSINRGFAYMTEVSLSGKTGFRVCMTNFRSTTTHLDSLLAEITSTAARKREWGD